MKKLLFCFAAVAVVVATGCKEDLPPKQGDDPPVVEKDAITEFFDENLYDIGESLFPEEGLPVLDKGVVINDPDDLCDTLYNGKPIYWPEIDFDSQTLIIGQWVASYAGYKILSKNVSVENGVATVELSVGHRNDGNMYPLVPAAIYFWGLYPKLDADSCKIVVPEMFTRRSIR